MSDEGQQAEDAPRFWGFAIESFHHLEEGFFWISKLDHAAKIYLAGEEMRVDKLASGGKGALLVDEGCEGAGDRGEGICMEHGGTGWRGRLRGRVSIGKKKKRREAHGSVPTEKGGRADLLGNVGAGEGANASGDGGLENAGRQEGVGGVDVLCGKETHEGVTEGGELGICGGQRVCGSELAEEGEEGGVGARGEDGGRVGDAEAVGKRGEGGGRWRLQQGPSFGREGRRRGVSGHEQRVLGRKTRQVRGGRGEPRCQADLRHGGSTVSRRLPASLMPVLSLPLSFTNSFWSADLRTGLDVLFAKLDQVRRLLFPPLPRSLSQTALENDEIVSFIRLRSAAESQRAAVLARTAPSSSTGFGADDGASLLMAFRGLQAEAVAQAKAHENVAKELISLVLDPFAEWAQGYKASLIHSCVPVLIPSQDRIRQTKSAVLDNWLRNYEQAQADVQKLKQQYLAKSRRADDVEDDAKFAPHSGGAVPDKYTNSPRLAPADAIQAPQRTATVSERITQRLRDIQSKGTSTFVNASADDSTEGPTPKADKGKGRAVQVGEVTSPVSLSPESSAKVSPIPSEPTAPEPILLGGTPFTPATVSQLLTRAASELPLRPVRFPLLGEYQDTFTGEEFVTWLQESIKEFAGNIDLAEHAAEVLTEKEGLLRRLGEFGNEFQGSDDAFYQFRPKVGLCSFPSLLLP